jgi:hypothetical protein
MKKLSILLSLATLSLIACVKNENQETANSRLIWADNVQSTVPLMRPDAFNNQSITPIDEEYWYAMFKYNKKNIFTSITNAVLSGKLKAYSSYNESLNKAAPLTPKEFENFLVRFDSVEIIDNQSKPNIKRKDVVKTEITKDYISSIKFQETMELDTISYTFVKHVNSVSFFVRIKDIDIGHKTNDLDEREIFHVQFN